MTRVSGVDDKFINKRPLDETKLEDQRQVSTKAVLRRSKNVVRRIPWSAKKSGPALAGPAAPATTALHGKRETLGSSSSRAIFIFSPVKPEMMIRS